ncbi:outer membrane protein [Helicobacter cetorum]|uniref:outer membrane protein n=1 Tax=Helicobacter cetorum TaxID=138563 RepID=UPI000CF07D75|nr:outer membrane protein [Helicobacter cetorum]
MNKAFGGGYLGVFLSSLCILDAEDFTYSIPKKEELGHRKFLKKKCLRNPLKPPCFTKSKPPIKKPFNLDKSSRYYGTSVVQMSWLQSTQRFKKAPLEFQSIPFAEISLILGYKHFFDKKGRYGLRYYAFLDYAYGFIPKSELANNAYFIKSTSIPKAYQNKLQKKETFINALIYGVGLDVLYRRAFGTLFLGINLVGESWFYETKIFKEWAKTPHTTYKPNMFQLMFNMGYRYRFSRHKNWAIEFGTRIPILNNHYFKSPTYELIFRRNLSIYLTSTYDF